MTKLMDNEEFVGGFGDEDPLDDGLYGEESELHMAMVERL